MFDEWHDDFFVSRYFQKRPLWPTKFAQFHVAIDDRRVRGSQDDGTTEIHVFLHPRYPKMTKNTRRWPTLETEKGLLETGLRDEINLGRRRRTKGDRSLPTFSRPFENRCQAQQPKLRLDLCHWTRSTNCLPGCSREEPLHAL